MQRRNKRKATNNNETVTSSVAKQNAERDERAARRLARAVVVEEKNDKSCDKPNKRVKHPNETVLGATAETVTAATAAAAANVPIDAVVPDAAPAPAANEPTNEPLAATADQAWKAQLTIGSMLDVLDTDHHWLASTIVETKDGYVFVHYHGWSDGWNEWIPISSPRLAPLGSKASIKHVVQAQAALPAPASGSIHHPYALHMHSFGNTMIVIRAQPEQTWGDIKRIYTERMPGVPNPMLLVVNGQSYADDETIERTFGPNLYMASFDVHATPMPR